LWSLLFDVNRVAALIPGCSDVQEREPLKHYAARIRQKVGPFKFEMPCDIVVDDYVKEQRVGITATGQDQKTATGTVVTLALCLEDAHAHALTLMIDADIQISGKLATLGFPVVKKKCMEIFREFNVNLNQALEALDAAKTV